MRARKNSSIHHRFLIIFGLMAIVATSIAALHVAGHAEAASLLVDKTVTTRQSTNSATITSPSLTTTQGGEVLVAFISADGPSTSAQSISAVTGGGLTWTLRQRTNKQRGTAEIWKASATGIVRDATIAAKLASGSYHGSITVVAFIGADLSVNGAVKSANGTKGGQTASLVTTRAGSWVWGVGEDWDGATARTVGTGQTVVDQFVDTAATATFWSQKRTATTASSGTTVQINDTAPTNHRWNLSEIEILRSSDQTAPVTAISAPTAGATISGTTTISATASDTGGIKQVQFYLDGALLSTATTSPYSYAWNTTSVTNGSHSLTTKAYDISGNVGTSPGRSVVVNNDKTTPVVSITSPTEGAQLSGILTITANATDNVGVNKVEFYRDTTLIGSTTAQPYSFSWDTAQVINGAYSLTAKAYDAAGNVGTSAQVNIAVQNVGPVNDKEIIFEKHDHDHSIDWQTTMTIQITKLSPDGTMTNLSTGSGGRTGGDGDFDRDPVVSPDGSKIAFIGDRLATDGHVHHYLMVMNSDGSGQRKLADVGWDGYLAKPAWSPNGQQIAYNQTYNVSFMFRINVDGSDNIDGSGGTQLTDSPNYESDGEALNPSWSPNGDRIAYYAGGYIRIMNADGSNKHAISGRFSGYDAYMPVWSPDGSRIYYYLAKGDQNDPQWGIFYLSSSDSFTSNNFTTHQLTSHDSNLGIADVPCGSDCKIAVSADSRTLLYMSVDKDDVCPGSIFILSSDGGVPRRVTNNSNCLVHYDAPSFATASFPTASAKRLVALGDSVAAGEGINYGYLWNGTDWIQTGPSVPSWTDTTSSTGSNNQYCHQTDMAYSRLFFADNYRVFNMACTGATAMGDSGLSNGGILDREVFDGGASPLAQLGGACAGCDAPNAIFDVHNADVVTLTIGANDIHFADWISTCYALLGSSCDTQNNTAALNSQLALEKANLRLVLQELNRRAALSGKVLRVLVTNYYNPFPADGAACKDIVWDAGVGITNEEKAWLSSGLSSLNSNISDEVTYAQTNDPNLNVSLVDLSGVTGVMAGHEYCSSDPWAYGPSIRYQVGNNSPAPFHPTPAGQRAIYEQVKRTLEGN